MPDYDDRKKLLESLKNRLEALLSPKLITSFNGHNTSEREREGGKEGGWFIILQFACYGQVDDILF